MLFSRNNLLKLFNLLESKSELHFSIITQYKILKIKKALKEEIEIYNTQLLSLNDFFEKNEYGEIIKNENGYKIKKECLHKCQETIEKLNNYKIQLPDIYFTLDELEVLDLSLGEIEILEPFIKN